MGKSNKKYKFSIDDIHDFELNSNNEDNENDDKHLLSQILINSKNDNVNTENAIFKFNFEKSNISMDKNKNKRKEKEREWEWDKKSKESINDIKINTELYSSSTSSNNSFSTPNKNKSLNNQDCVTPDRTIPPNNSLGMENKNNTSRKNKSKEYENELNDKKKKLKNEIEIENRNKNEIKNDEKYFNIMLKNKSNNFVNINNKIKEEVDKDLDIKSINLNHQQIYDKLIKNSNPNLDSSIQALSLSSSSSSSSSSSKKQKQDNRFNSDLTPLKNKNNINIDSRNILENKGVTSPTMKISNLIHDKDKTVFSIDNIKLKKLCRTNEDNINKVVLDSDSSTNDNCIKMNSKTFNYDMLISNIINKEKKHDKIKDSSSSSSSDENDSLFPIIKGKNNTQKENLKDYYKNMNKEVPMNTVFMSDFYDSDSIDNEKESNDDLESELLNDEYRIEKIKKEWEKDVLTIYSGFRNERTMIKEAKFYGNSSQFVVSGSDEGKIFFWEKESAKVKAIYNGDRHVVNCICPHPFNATIVTSGIEYNIKIWEPLADEKCDLKEVNDILKKNEEIINRHATISEFDSLSDSMDEDITFDETIVRIPYYLNDILSEDHTTTRIIDLSSDDSTNITNTDLDDTGINISSNSDMAINTDTDSNSNIESDTDSNMDINSSDESSSNSDNANNSKLKNIEFPYSFPYFKTGRKDIRLNKNNKNKFNNHFFADSSDSENNNNNNSSSDDDNIDEPMNVYTSSVYSKTTSSESESEGVIFSTSSSFSLYSLKEQDKKNLINSKKINKNRNKNTNKNKKIIYLESTSSSSPIAIHPFQNKNYTNKKKKEKKVFNNNNSPKEKEKGKGKRKRINDIHSIKEKGKEEEDDDDEDEDENDEDEEKETVLNNTNIISQSNILKQSSTSSSSSSSSIPHSSNNKNKENQKNDDDNNNIDNLFKSTECFEKKNQEKIKYKGKEKEKKTNDKDKNNNIAEMDIDDNKKK